MNEQIGVDLDFVSLLADARHIARQSESFTEQQRISIFNTIAVLQCAVKDDQQ